MEDQSRRLTLLDLPLEVRCRIYELVGIVSNPFWVCSEFGHQPYQPRRQLWQRLDDNCDGCSGGFVFDLAMRIGRLNFYGLLLSCRTIYAEASRLLYSRNKFFLTVQTAKSLRSLRHLTPSSISYLGSLVIHLNIASADKCNEGNLRLDRFEGSLSVSSQRGAQLLAEWDSTAQYLGEHLVPNQLDLYLTCDCRDIKTARRVVSAMDVLPTLRNCHIRLKQRPNVELRKMSKYAALKAIGCAPSTSAFPFLRLPPEIRLQILEYTDLVTPLNEVEWNPEDGYLVRLSKKLHNLVGTLNCPPFYEHGNIFYECWRRYRSEHGCFCRRKHSAYSPTCQCWDTPASLFLVCKRFRQEALSVYLSCNRIMIMPRGNPHDIVVDLGTKLPASILLKSILPPFSLRHLRSVDIVFPPVSAWHYVTAELYHDWIHTVDYLAERVSQPGLILRVYMASCVGNVTGPKAERRQMTEAQGNNILVGNSLMMEPFARMDKLRWFFAHCAWPWEITDDTVSRMRQNPGQMKEFIRNNIAQINQSCEQMVLGARYNPETANLLRSRHGLWWNRVNSYFT